MKTKGELEAEISRAIEMIQSISNWTAYDRHPSRTK